jgi:hypothetical protein
MAHCAVQLAHLRSAEGHFDESRVLLQEAKSIYQGFNIAKDVGDCDTALSEL